jgi:hypothetical protein
MNAINEGGAFSKDAHMNANGSWSEYADPWTARTAAYIQLHGTPPTREQILEMYFRSVYSSSNLTVTSVLSADGGYNLNYYLNDAVDDNGSLQAFSLFVSDGTAEEFLRINEELNGIHAKDPWGAAAMINETLGVTIETTGQAMVGAQKLVQNMSESSKTILKGGEFFEGVTRISAITGMVLVGVDGAVNGWQAHHTAELIVDTYIYSLGVAVPVGGWIVGAAWFAANLIYEHYNDGHSILQDALDPY